MPLTSAELPKAAEPEDITKAWGIAWTAYIHMDLRFQSGLGHEHGPQTPTWPPVVP